MIRYILFVCTGNTCRSPMAEAIARAAAADRGLDVLIGSGGLTASGGTPAAGPANVVAKRHGLDLSHHSSRPISEDLLSAVDLVLGMTARHCAALLPALPRGRVTPVTSFLPPEHQLAGKDIDDPFGGTEEDYELVFAQLSVAIEALLDHIEENAEE